MTDRELLELAAKAAGRKYNVSRDSPSGWFLATACEAPDGSIVESDIWRPLKDDGDALRLVMTLDMSVNCNRDELTVIVQTWRPRLFKKVSNNVKDADVRRCIVEVAAQIWKAMP